MSAKEGRVSLHLLKGKNKTTTNQVMPIGLSSILARKSIKKTANVIRNFKLYRPAASQRVRLLDQSITYSMVNPERILKLDLPQILPLTHSTFKPDEKHLPAITTILRDTMPAQAAYLLQKWRRAMIKKLGQEGFIQYTNETFSRGKKLHSMVERFFLEKEPPKECSEEVAVNLWKSIEGVLKERVSNVRLVEHTVTHNQMGYRGIVDAVGFFDNKLTVIDFKTTVKQKLTDLSLYDSPLQVSAYCGALNHDPELANDILGGNVTCGVLIYAYTDGSPASVHYFDEEKLAKYWSEWCTRLFQYQKYQLHKESSFKPATTTTRAN